jgi:hypothetical protein
MRLSIVRRLAAHIPHMNVCDAVLSTITVKGFVDVAIRHFSKCSYAAFQLIRRTGIDVGANASFKREAGAENLAIQIRACNVASSTDIESAIQTAAQFVRWRGCAGECCRH